MLITIIGANKEGKWKECSFHYTDQKQRGSYTAQAVKELEGQEPLLEIDWDNKLISPL